MCIWELGVEERGGGWGVRRLIDELILLMWDNGMYLNVGQKPNWIS